MVRRPRSLAHEPLDLKAALSSTLEYIYTCTPRMEYLLFECINFC
jgi:hypothetical protein